MLLVIVVFYAAILWTARRFRRRIETLRDFFLAGRSLGAFPVALCFAASWFGAGSTIASMTLFHHKGWAGAWELAIPSALSCALITFAFSRRVARQESLSQPEAVERHYGRVGRLGLALVILMAVSTFLGSQLVAASMLFQSVLGLDPTAATLIFSALVVSYVMMGGFFTVVITDMAQMAMIVLALGILLAYCLGASPDPGAALGGSVTWAGLGEFGRPWGYHLALTAAFVMAWSVAPEMWQRMSATRNEGLAFRGALGATLLLIGLFAMVASIGILSAQIIPNSERVLMDLAQKLPHPLLGGLALAGVLAAISSTMDSSLNVGSLTLTRDIYQGFIRPNASTRELLLASRLSTALVCAPAIALALKFQNIIQILWISADIYASAMFVPIVGILYLKHPPRLAGLLAMGAGGAMMALNALSQYGLIAMPAQWPGWPYATLLGVGASLTGFAIGWAWTALKKPPAVSPSAPA
ncbi:MAG: sodium:solute symporter family protein [Vampirovibrionales bacterium]|nr:sodium:solute symporter family protein [Vampirovibrionales bacterium]